jgi:hypothetical protein
VPPPAAHWRLHCSDWRNAQSSVLSGGLTRARAREAASSGRENFFLVFAAMAAARRWWLAAPGIDERAS